MERHVLVLGRGRRGVCVFLAVHGAGVLAHPQVGEPCRRTAQRPLPRAYSLYNRRFDSGASAQSALHPGHRPCVLLPQVAQCERQRLARGAGAFLRAGGSHSLRTCAGLHEGGAAVRTFLRQRSGPRLQYGRAHLCRGARGRAVLGGVGAISSEKCRIHPLELPAGADSQRSAFHRPVVAGRRHCSGACRMAVRVLPETARACA